MIYDENRGKPEKLVFSSKSAKFLAPFSSLVLRDGEERHAPLQIEITGKVF